MTLQAILDRSCEDARTQKRLAEFDAVPDTDFIRSVLRGSRYLDNQSRANAREALRRLDRLTDNATHEKDGGYVSDGTAG